jgi:hypothetical protein
MAIPAAFAGRCTDALDFWLGKVLTLANIAVARPLRALSVLIDWPQSHYLAGHCGASVGTVRFSLVGVVIVTVS